MCCLYTLCRSTAFACHQPDEFNKVEQFSAIVFSINEQLHFIAFSGTDDTLVGWIEDLEMSFRDEVPAQRMLPFTRKR